MMLGLPGPPAAGAAGSARIKVIIELADTARIAQGWRIFISVSSVVRRWRGVAWDTRGGGVIFPSGWKNAPQLLVRTGERGRDRGDAGVHGFLGNAEKAQPDLGAEIGEMRISPDRQLHPIGSYSPTFPANC